MTDNEKVRGAKTIQIIIMLCYLAAFWQMISALNQIEHDLNVIAVEQIKIEHQDDVENQSAYVRK